MKNLNFPQASWLLLSMAIVASLLSSSCKDELIEKYGSETVFTYTTSGVWDSSDVYLYSILLCRANLQPVEVLEENGTTGAFFNNVASEFPVASGWSYSSSPGTLSDKALHVRTYDVLGTPTKVGAEIHVKYFPHGTDPTNVHWVQVITTNHSLKAPSGHGNSASYVDIPTGQSNPYYDDAYAADATNLYDFPSRSDADLTHNWEAITYLCTGPAIGAGPGAIQFLRPGIRWGWINSCTPRLGDHRWYFNLERAMRFAFEPSLEPGTTVQLKADSASAIVLMKDQGRGAVPVERAELALVLGPKLDAGGFYPFQIKGGTIAVGDFTFQDEPVPSKTSEVKRGSGYIHWETGEASLQIEVEMPLPGGKSEAFVFTGNGKVDRQGKTFVLAAGTKGVERKVIEELKKQLKE